MERARAEPVWKAIADDLEERAPDVAELRTNSTWHADEADDPLFDSPPDVAELRTNSTWHADEDDDPLFHSRREYLEQIDPDGSRARF